MPKINIDELCEPIEVTVAGKNYVVEDIPRDLAKKMQKLGEAVEDSGESGETDRLADIMTEILGADEEDIAKLGMRKLLMLVKLVMGTINDELEAKNAPEVVVPK